LLLLCSCKEPVEEEIKPDGILPVQLIKNLNADVAGLNQYTFFSFRENDTISRTDSATLNWDIAFKNTTILFNSGTSGPGTAQVQLHTGTFEELVMAPTDGYKSDGAVPAIPAGSGNGWYNYSGSPTHIITPIPGRILLIKTCQGNYVKMEILSYYKNMPASPVNTDPSRYYTFRFVHQSNGSRNIQ
jgi:hypothetical protein